MAMTDFTPGPWVYQKPGGRKSAVVRTLEVSQMSLPDSCICELFGTGDDEMRANARLIATAPKMYAVLKALVIKNDRVLAALAEVEGK